MSDKLGRPRTIVYIDDLEERIVPIEIELNNISQSVEKITTNELPHIQAKCEDMDLKVDALIGQQTEFSTNMKWVKPLLIGIIGTSIVGILGLISTIIFSVK